MARTIDTIQAQIIANMQSNPALAGLTSTSRRAIWRNITRVIAIAINLLEQVMDLFKSDIEVLVNSAAPATASWLQKKSLEFQYDATNPQIVQLVNMAPVYPVIAPELRIITRCSVKSELSGITRIKVAKSEPPAALSSGELSAFQDYINIIGIAGVNYIAQSTAADRLYIDADIYYQGQYSAIIQQTVIDAIESFLANIPFDGVMKVVDIENTIRDVAGVNDVVLKNVRARDNATALASSQYLVNNQQLISRLWTTNAGYIIQEDTTGSTFVDTLNFISE